MSQPNPGSTPPSPSAPDRADLIRSIEKLRGSNVICYLTSLRENVPAVIAHEHVRVFFDHLRLLPKRPSDKLDIFLVSNGGDSVVPWRLVSLFREFTSSFNVLIPFRAYSAATLIALGADEIVMHPFGEIGPIDPTVTNAFNPKENGRSLGISVEDLKAYVSFVKNTVGITHEDELVKTIEILAQQVHPLALGNVERFVNQSRITATKILKTHMKDNEHVIRETVEMMGSKLYFHGHPINRKEAKEDVGLKITQNLDPELENLMWDLYLDFEREFENRNPFYPLGDLCSMAGAATKTKDYTLLHGLIESTGLTSRNVSKRRYTLIQPQPGQRALDEAILSLEWNHSKGK